MTKVIVVDMDTDQDVGLMERWPRATNLRCILETNIFRSHDIICKYMLNKQFLC